MRRHFTVDFPTAVGPCKITAVGSTPAQLRFSRAAIAPARACPFVEPHHAGLPLVQHAKLDA
ncbi:MAG: hypothetical protein ACLP1X_11545 [Polyangiaceae bacterium]